MQAQRFRTELEMGHKGCAVIVPFDPEKLWGAAPTKVLGESMGHFVEGTMNGAPFQGWIGHRWGRFFILVDDALAKAAAAKPGDRIDVVVSPRAASPTTETSRPAARRKRPRP
jgi:hypothetical protein